MKRCQYAVLAAILTLALGSAANAAEARETQLTSAPALDGRDITDFCETQGNAEGLFQILSSDRVCIARVLKGSVIDPKERVSLSTMASSYLAASQSRSIKSLPLPLQVLGSMVADTITTNLEARHATPELPQPSPLAARNLPRNERAPVNWAAIGLARAQAAGSCEAVTVELFKKLARDTDLSGGQRLQAQKIARAFGISNLYPDDRCVS